jgi:hypothetical protein
MLDGAAAMHETCPIETSYSHTFSLGMRQLPPALQPEDLHISITSFWKYPNDVSLTLNFTCLLGKVLLGLMSSVISCWQVVLHPSPGMML